MNITIDAYAILAVLLDDSKKNEVLRKTQNAFLISPECIDYEIGGILLSLVKRKKILARQAGAIFDEYKKVLIRKEKIDIKLAVKIASKNALCACDAYYLACAAQCKTPLLTLDKKLFYIAKKMGVVCL